MADQAPEFVHRKCHTHGSGCFRFHRKWTGSGLRANPRPMESRSHHHLGFFKCALKFVICSNVICSGRWSACKVIVIILNLDYLQRAQTAARYASTTLYEWSLVGLIHNFDKKLSPIFGLFSSFLLTLNPVRTLWSVPTSSRLHRSEILVTVNENYFVRTSNIINCVQFYFLGGDIRRYEQ